MFSVRLTPPTCDLPLEAALEPLEDQEDYEYLVIHSCTLLAQTDCKFHIGGFGTNDWNFDTSYDASSFLEQLPRMLQAAKAREDFDVDLYPQGTERKLRFTYSGPLVNISCDSRTSWTPKPSVENHASDVVAQMLEDLAASFSASLKMAVPQVAALPPFSGWNPTAR